MEVPVYLVNGFLESGKTLFIDDALKSEDFADGEDPSYSLRGGHGGVR